MQLGIFTKTFPRNSIEAVFAAVADHGLTTVQLNLECLGLAAMPDEIDPALMIRARDAAAAAGVTIAAVSGTFNMVHPDPGQRRLGLRRLATLAEASAHLGTGIITLSTGTRDPVELWRRHPDNETGSTWRSLLRAMEEAIGIAEDANVTLAFEPERENVVNTPDRAADLLRTMASHRLRVVIDAANLVDPPEAATLPDVLEHAFDLLREHIVLAHAKDRLVAGTVVPAGQGTIPWTRYLARLGEMESDCPLILHGLSEADVPGAVAFLKGVESEG